MTGANGDENLFKALTTASTLLLKLGLFIYLFIIFNFWFNLKVKCVNLIVT
jgi:hypothetical protein